MGLNKRQRYVFSGALFLALYLASDIFGGTMWHFIAAQVGAWWQSVGPAHLIGALAGLAAFLFFQNAAFDGADWKNVFGKRGSRGSA